MPSLTRHNEGQLGIWGGLRSVFSEAEEQRFSNHRMRNVLDKLPKKKHSAAQYLLREIPYADTAKQAEGAKPRFQRWAREVCHGRAATVLDADWERLLTFQSFPKKHWKHLRTSSIVESPFSTVRLRSDASRRYKRVAGAKAVIWKMLRVAGRRWRQLDAPELLPLVAWQVESQHDIQREAKKECREPKIQTNAVAA